MPQISRTPRTTWRRGLWIPPLGLATCFILLSGCSGDEEGAEAGNRTSHERLVIASDTAEGFEEPGEPLPVTPVQGDQGPAEVMVGGPLTVFGELRGSEEDAPAGSVTVTAAGAGTQLLVTIGRSTQGTTLVASLVRGRCDAPGDVVARIGDPFVVQQSGFATLRSRLPMATLPILDGTHSVRIHEPAVGGPELAVACADLPVVDMTEQ